MSQATQGAPIFDKLTPGVWAIDPVHSIVEFSVRHMMVSNIKGFFTAFSGAITIGEDRYSSAVEATIETASLTTHNDTRDNHLRSADFFDIETYPTMEFRSTSVGPSGDSHLVAGDLTIRGITRPVNLSLSFEGVGADTYGATRCGFIAATDVSRRDFGLTWDAPLETGGVALGDRVAIMLHVEGVRQD